MTSLTLPRLPLCGQPATVRIEVYAPAGGLAHGSLDGSVYSCAEHHAPVRAALHEAGFTPYTVPGADPGTKRCGDGADFTGERTRFLTAPEPASEAHVKPAGEAPKRVRRFDTKAGRWRWWNVAERTWGDDEYQLVIREAGEDTVVDVVRDGAVLLTWTFGEACEVAQQLADWFGTFTGPASRTDADGPTERCPIHKVPMAYVACDWPYWFCPVSGDPGHGSWVPEHDCPGGAR